MCSTGVFAMQPKLRHPQRLTDAAARVTPAGYFRVHLHPRRFPQVYSVNWKARILAETDSYVAVNKPWGVQVPHRVDNVRESLVACITAVCPHPCSYSVVTAVCPRLCCCY